jgi:NTE family protein/lysophospholipid hydrolase
MDLLNYLKCLPIFANLEPDAAQALADALGRKQLAAGMLLFHQGDPADAFYIVLTGRMQVSVRSAIDLETLSELGAGDCIGEMSMLTGQPRTATITALDDTELLCLEKATFDMLVEKYPNFLSGLASQLLPRFQKDQINLSLFRLFGRLDEAVLAQLLGKLGWRRINSGGVLFRQGEPGDEMYIVVQGRLRFIAEDRGGGQRVLGEVGAGECIGEFALLAEKGSPDSRRSATVIASRLTDMIVLTRQVFEDLLCQYPQALLNLARQIVRRSTAVAHEAPLAENATDIVLLPVRAGQDLGPFARQLAEALSAFGSTLFLDPEIFDRLYGKPGAAATPIEHPLSLVINAWLDEREHEHRHIVYATSPVLDESGRLTPWAQRCVEDADIVLLVGEAGDDPQPSMVESALRAAGCGARVELVLLHPADCAVPLHTNEWLAPRSSGGLAVQAHHHVRRGNAADFRRLVRRMAGKPVGLVLSGGGARGWAHVGVLQAMEEMGMEYDWVGGASMGAIVAAGCALGWDSRRLRDLAAQFSDPKKLLDYTLPYASVTSTKRITAMLQELYSGAEIEDTWHPFFCVSANLTKGVERLHTRGPLWKTVRASMAFPGIFAPVLDEGCVLIDGGAANNLPIDRMRELCPDGTVIGVNLEFGDPIKGEFDFGPSLSGWQALAGRISRLPGRVRAPNLLNIVAGLVDGTTRYRLNETWHCADLMVTVDVEPYGLLEFDRYPEIIAAGYEAAKEQIKEI